MMEEMGIKWETFPWDYGTKYIYDETDTSKFRPPIAEYKCCTKCHLPFDQAEATRINKLLGNELNEEPIDEDFLEILNDF
jgi:hypothetical protein